MDESPYKDITQSLDNVALIVTKDSKVIKDLIKYNSTLVENNNKLMEEVKRIKEALKNKGTLNNIYFWTHGYKVARYHTSKTCNRRDKGHQEEDNSENTMGGSELGKDKSTRS